MISSGPFSWRDKPNEVSVFTRIGLVCGTTRAVGDGWLIGLIAPNLTCVFPIKKGPTEVGPYKLIERRFRT
ncbi:hypothetical protein GCM10009069_06780 [Algimonas arctica]|uniref:Uncharacterized protein n=1 Tax=Algimonas arctica TaxID=1479486 RepID=A0A8J3CQL0_9PROT|nr:hypothetical protein GCM10009069_06780 [Algimonas arctica]